MFFYAIIITIVCFVGTRALERKGTRAVDGQESGISGLKDLGVRELTYKIAFFACTVIPANGRVGFDTYFLSFTR